MAGFTAPVQALRPGRALAGAVGLVLCGTQAFAASEGGAPGVFPPFDSSTFASQLLWLAITFGLFYYLMSKIALPRISDILETRSDRIAQDLDEANRLKEESDAAIAAYEQELATARSNAHAIAQEARDAAKAELDGKRTALEADLAEKIAEAEKSIGEMREKAMADVAPIAEETASAMVAELVGGKVTKAELSAAVTRAGS